MSAPDAQASEPAWIEHDGSAVCPVPAGHDCEIIFGDGHIKRDKKPESWGWGWDGAPWPHGKMLVAKYRDWTAFAQASEGAVGEVAEWVEPVKALLNRTENFMMGAVRVSGTPEYRAVRALLAAHAPAPVDPLAVLVEEANATALRRVFKVDDVSTSQQWLDEFVAELRARLPAAAVAAVEGEG